MYCRVVECTPIYPRGGQNTRLKEAQLVNQLSDTTTHGKFSPPMAYRPLNLTGSHGPITPCMLPVRSCWYAAQRMARWPYSSSRLRSHIVPFSPPPSRTLTLSHDVPDSSDTESGVERPEHAVISTFDLFSIGGKCSRFLWLILEIVTCLPSNSWPEQLAYSWTNACWKDIHQ